MSQTDPDRGILAAARRVLASDPRAPMSVVAGAAGVGMSALYRRFPSKSALLRALVAEVESAYLTQLDRAHAAIDEGRDGYEVLVEFVLALLQAGAASLSPRLPGMTEAGAQDVDRWTEISERNRALFERVSSSGALREGVTFHDFGLVVFALGTVQGPDPERTWQLQQRIAVVVLDGLRPVHGPLPGAGASRRDIYGTGGGPPPASDRRGRPRS